MADMQRTGTETCLYGLFPIMHFASQKEEFSQHHQPMWKLLVSAGFGKDNMTQRTLLDICRVKCMKAVAPYILLQLKITMLTAVLEFHFIHWHFVNGIKTGYLVHSLGLLKSDSNLLV